MRLCSQTEFGSLQIRTSISFYTRKITVRSGTEKNKNLKGEKNLKKKKLKKLQI